MTKTFTQLLTTKERTRKKWLEAKAVADQALGLYREACEAYHEAEMYERVRRDILKSLSSSKPTAT